MNLVTVGLLRRRKEEKSWAECKPLLMRSQKRFSKQSAGGLGLGSVGSWAGEAVLTKGEERLFFRQKGSLSHDDLAPDLAGDYSDAQKSQRK